MSERDRDQILDENEEMMNKVISNVLTILTNPFIYVWSAYVAYLVIAIAILPIFYGTSPVFDNGPIDFFMYFILSPITTIGLAFVWEYARHFHPELRWIVVFVALILICIICAFINMYIEGLRSYAGMLKHMYR